MTGHSAPSYFSLSFRIFHRSDGNLSGNVTNPTQGDLLMTPIKPEALHGQTFSKTEFGYDPAEVDEHIRRLTENYSLLYRENASLLKQLRETGARLRTLEAELSRADHILKDAQAQRDEIVEEAYLKADNILASVQMNCDSILRHFKEKAEAQEKIEKAKDSLILKLRKIRKV